jgi:hypothetical protein
MKNKVITEIIGSLLICLFIYAFVSKIIEYQLFANQLSKNPFLKHFAGTVALVVPLSEILVAGLLVFKRTQLNGLYGSLILLSIFSVYIILLYLSGKPLPCSCGGFVGLLSWPQHLLFNSIFILLSATGIILYKKKVKNRSIK